MNKQGRKRLSDATLRGKLSILLSAYACEPDAGSEPGLGWQWAVNLARLGNQVCVITRRENQEVIEASRERQDLSNLRFVYLGLPVLGHYMRKGSRSELCYYFLWQLMLYFVARKLVRKMRFDIAHHVTFATARFPSLVGLLKIPFIFGPVAGGDYAPVSLWRGLGPGVRLHESLRRVSNFWIRYSPLMNLTFFTARKIFVTSEQTAALLPRYAKARSSVLLGITANRYTDSLGQRPLRQRGAGAPFQVFFAGRLVSLKGMHFGLKAFARLQREVAGAQLTMIGSGPMLRQWRKLADELGIGASVSWRDSMPRTEFLRALTEFDVLLFPSLHDSGGMVVMEAMAAGIPVICLDVGGPGILVDKSCGFAIAPTSPVEVESGLCEALAALARNESLRTTLGQNARSRVITEFGWDRTSAFMQKVYLEHTEDRCASMAERTAI
jgi:glycosyltransferase involved in cell wall biosynthesis